MASVADHGPPGLVESSAVGEEDESVTVTGSPAVYAVPAFVCSSTVSGVETAPGATVCAGEVNASRDGFQVPNVRQAVVAVGAAEARRCTRSDRRPPPATSPESAIAAASRTSTASVWALKSAVGIPARFFGDQAKPKRSLPAERSRVRLRRDVVLHQLDRDVRPAEGGVVAARPRSRAGCRSAAGMPRAASADAGATPASALSCWRYSLSKSRRASRRRAGDRVVPDVAVDLLRPVARDRPGRSRMPRPRTSPAAVPGRGRDRSSPGRSRRRTPPRARPAARRRRRRGR